MGNLGGPESQFNPVWGISQSNVVPRILNVHQDDKDTCNGLYLASHLREQ